MRLSIAVDRYLAYRQLERDATPRSLDSYWRILSKLVDLYPEARLSDFEGREGTDKLRDFLGAWAKRSAATRANVISVLHSFFAWAEAEDLIESDPSRRIRRPPKRKPDVYRPSESELGRARERTTIHERPAWLLMEGVGLRAAEVLSLRWRDLDLTRARIRVRVKGNHWRNIPIPQDIADELRTVFVCLAPDPEHMVFAPEVEQWVSQERRVRYVKDPAVPASHRALWRMTRRACERAGVRRLSPHQLRHGFATRLRRRGVDESVIQFMLGHSSADTTKLYFDEIEIEEAQEAVSAAFAQAPPAEATKPGRASKPLVEAGGIEPPSATAGEEETSGSELDDPHLAENGVTSEGGNDA